MIEVTDRSFTKSNNYTLNENCNCEENGFLTYPYIVVGDISLSVYLHLDHFLKGALE